MKVTDDEEEGRGKAIVLSDDECRREFAEWSRHVKSELERVDDDIESYESEIEAAEDEITHHGNIKQLVGVGLGVVGGIVAVVSTPIGILLAIAAAGVTIDGTIRSMLWRPKKRKVLALIQAAKQERRDWQSEQTGVEDARRSIERRLAEEKQQKALPAVAAPVRQRKKTRP